MRAERRGRVARVRLVVNRRGREEPGERTEAAGSKPFEISKWVVWEAFRRVKANKGAAGVDEESIEEFEADLRNGTCTRSGTGCPRAPTSRRR